MSYISLLNLQDCSFYVPSLRCWRVICSFLSRPTSYALALELGFERVSQLSGIHI